MLFQKFWLLFNHAKAQTLGPEKVDPYPGALCTVILLAKTQKEKNKIHKNIM